MARSPTSVPAMEDRGLSCSLPDLGQVAHLKPHDRRGFLALLRKNSTMAPQIYFGYYLKQEQNSFSNFTNISLCLISLSKHSPGPREASAVQTLRLLLYFIPLTRDNWSLSQSSKRNCLFSPCHNAQRCLFNGLKMRSWVSACVRVLRIVSGI